MPGCDPFPPCSVRTSLGTARVLLRVLLSPFVSVCSWILPSLANLALPTPLRRQSCLLPQLTCHHVLLQLHSILSLHFILLFCFLLTHLCTMLPALQACRKRLDHSLSLPAENWTCFIEANPQCLSCTHHCSRPALSPFRLECFECADYVRPAQQCFQLGRPFASKMKGLTTFALLNVIHL